MGAVETGAAGQGTHSFVVPAYGRSPHLAACLDSLSRQSSRSQIVVATSTPFPELQDIAASHGARVVVHGPNAGIGHDWNHALSSVTTRWATLAHQDDVYLPEFAAKTMALAQAAPDAVMLFTDYAELLADGRERRNSGMLAIKRLLLELGFLGAGSIRSPAAKRRLLCFGCPIPCPAVTLRVDRRCVEFREDLRVNLDWDAWVRLATDEGAFAYSRQILLLHRLHAGSETSAGVIGGVRAKEDLMMFERLWPGSVARLLARVYALSYAAGGE